MPRSQLKACITKKTGNIAWFGVPFASFANIAIVTNVVFANVGMQWMKRKQMHNYYPARLTVDLATSKAYMLKIANQPSVGYWIYGIERDMCLSRVTKCMIFSASLAICAGNSPVTSEFPAQRPVTQSFNVFYDLRQNKRLSKQWWGWWFETPSRPFDVIVMCIVLWLVGSVQSLIN